VTFVLPLCALALIVFLSGVFSGSEIGMYSLSRPRLAS
jgi:Mg2+/Co2+ transporter CorB